MKKLIHLFSLQAVAAALIKITRLFAKFSQKRIKKILGTFGCKAFDKFSIFKLVGGLNKGHPDENDFKNAQEFILDIINKYESADK